MTTINILFLIDIQNGFANPKLTPAQGGSLYVPGGEKVGQPAADLMHHLSDSIVILSQDFHPKGHISFASSHPGAQPFSDIALKSRLGGPYKSVAIGTPGAMTQKLWPDHCVQNTDSALFVDPIMGELPPDLRYAVATHLGGPSYTDSDDRGNSFYVIRKGMRRDLDSYGIATENDGLATTEAPKLFDQIASKLQRQDVTKAIIDIGGLATNYCLEFSHHDIQTYLIPALRVRGIDTVVHLLTDISAGIPVTVPDGAWPDLAATTARLAESGTGTRTTEDVIRSFRQRRGPSAPAPSLIS